MKYFTSALPILALGLQPTNAMMDMNMPMSFWKGYKLTWLFYDLTSDDKTQYFGGLMTCFCIAIGLQLIAYLRNYIYIKA